MLPNEVLFELKPFNKSEKRHVLSNGFFIELVGNK